MSNTILAYKALNSLGLLSDIIGVILIFKFALQPKVNSSEIVNIVTEDSSISTDEEIALYDKRARLGIRLVVAGFVLQFLSNFIEPFAAYFNMS